MKSQRKPSDRLERVAGIVFNLDDPDQLRMYEHLMRRRNKSSYLKMLIFNDLSGNRDNSHEVIDQIEVDPDVADSFL